MRVAILASHPIQYQAPWFRALATQVDLQVFFADQPTRAEQAVGFGGAFTWDIDLLSGYSHVFLGNQARTPSSSSFFGSDTPEIGEIIRKGAFDAFIVSGWNLKSYWQAIRECRKLKVPLLIRGDSQLGSGGVSPKTLLKTLIYPRMLKSFDGFLSVGARNRQYLQHYGVPDDKIFFVPHFVDNSWFREAANKAGVERDRLRQSWGVDDRTLVALFVGKMIPKKRPADLLKAIRSISATAEVMCVFVGSGELDDYVRMTATQFKVPARFEGFRNQSELPAYYSAADALVLPSDERETWGLVVNEAMACGCPAVVSDAAGSAADLIDEGKTGFTYRMGDIKSLAERLLRLSLLLQSNFDFHKHLDEKLRVFSVATATAGTLQAVRRFAMRPVESDLL